MGTWSEISKDSAILEEIKMSNPENEKAEEAKEEERKRLYSVASVTVSNKTFYSMTQELCSRTFLLSCEKSVVCS